MKTIMITGGTSGLGKGLAMYYLKQGEQVIVIGHSLQKGERFLEEAKGIEASKKAHYFQADLSLKSENQRIIEAIKSQFEKVDALIFCSTMHSKVYTETSEGLELTFALDYLSRFQLNYGLKDWLEKSENPMILNVCGTGMRGAVNWKDLQHKKQFSPQKVMMHGSRLNDLSGVAFHQNDKVGKINYILYNPMAVRTPGMSEFGNSFFKFIFKLIGKPVEQAILPIISLLENPPKSKLSAHRENKLLKLSLPTYNENNAQRLYQQTAPFLEGIYDEK